VKLLTDNKRSPPFMTYSTGDHSGGKWSNVYSKPPKYRMPKSQIGHGSSDIKNTSGALSTVDQNKVEG
jgi:hypothetical protein